MQTDLIGPDFAALAAAGKLAQNAEPNKPRPTDGDKWVGELKYDGWRILAVVADDAVTYFARSGNTYTVPENIGAEILAEFPAGSVIDGEIVALTTLESGHILNEWGTVQSLLSKHGAKAAHDKVSFMVFDLISHRGIDARALSYDKRRALLEQIFAAGDFKAVKLTPQVPVGDAAYAKVVELGFEGIVYKRRAATYASDKREGAGWTKAKPTISIEGVVMGFTEGKDGFKGMVGALVFGQHDANGKLVERGRVSGMDMRTRLEMTADWKWMNDSDADPGYKPKWLGAVVEIAHEGVNIGQTESDRFRFPRFKRRRKDKAPEQVVIHDG